jgi:hypothetical protein
LCGGSNHAEEFEMSHSISGTNVIGIFEDIETKLRIAASLNEVVICSTVGDEAGNWRDGVIGDVQEAIRLLLSDARDQVGRIRASRLTTT